VRDEEVLLRVKEQRNILHEISKRKADWIGHILRSNCLLQRVTEGKIKGGIEVTGRRGRRRRKLLDDLKERRGYCHLKEEALHRLLNEWINVCVCVCVCVYIYIYIYIEREREREREGGGRETGRERRNGGGRKALDDHNYNIVILKTACWPILESILLTNGIEKDHAKRSIPATRVAISSTYLEMLQTIRKSPYMGVVARFNICRLLKEKTELNESHIDN